MGAISTMVDTEPIAAGVLMFLCSVAWAVTLAIIAFFQHPENPYQPAHISTTILPNRTCKTTKVFTELPDQVAECGMCDAVITAAPYIVTECLAESGELSHNFHAECYHQYQRETDGGKLRSRWENGEKLDKKSKALMNAFRDVCPECGFHVRSYTEIVLSTPISSARVVPVELEMEEVEVI